MEPDEQEESFGNQAIHFVRTATIANMTLSQMADSKASMLMGAIFVAFTISLGQAGDGVPPLPLLVLAISSSVAAVFAVMVVAPTFRPPRVPPGKENLLFFGVFAELDEQEWADQVIARLRTDETMFRTMLRDVWQNGRVLQRKKYRYLALAYWTFLGGFLIALTVFLIEVARGTLGLSV